MRGRKITLLPIPGHRLGNAGQLFDERPEHIVGAGAKQLVLAAVTAGTPTPIAPAAWAAAMSFGGVAENEQALGVERRSRESRRHSIAMRVSSPRSAESEP